MKNIFQSFVCGAALLAALSAAHAVPNPPIYMSHGVEYMSGGIGKDEAELMETVSPRWAATFEFATKDRKGADFAANVRVTVRDSVCSYANINESKLEQVTLQGCDLREASLSQMRLKRLKLETCDLTRAELFRTILRNVDLSSCNIQALRTSDTFVELRGAKIDLDQAPDIIGLLGVKLV
jgi:hypothetical protein